MAPIGSTPRGAAKVAKVRYDFSKKGPALARWFWEQGTARPRPRSPHTMLAGRIGDW